LTPGHTYGGLAPLKRAHLRSLQTVAWASCPCLTGLFFAWARCPCHGPVERVCRFAVNGDVPLASAREIFLFHFLGPNLRLNCNDCFIPHGRIVYQPLMCLACRPSPHATLRLSVWLAAHAHISALCQRMRGRQ